MGNRLIVTAQIKYGTIKRLKNGRLNTKMNSGHFKISSKKRLTVYIRLQYNNCTHIPIADFLLVWFICWIGVFPYKMNIY